MRRALGVVCAVFLACGCLEARAAEFPYSADLTLFYLGKAPADGKFLQEKFLFTATAKEVSPKDFNIYADLSTGPGTPVLQKTVCNVGEIKPGWTVAYRGVSCNWSSDSGSFVVPPGKTLYASYSTAFAPFVATDRFSTFRVKTEAVKPYPGSAPPACAPPAAAAGGAKGTSVTVDVYQMPGAVASDGTLDQTKICVVGTPHGQDVVGLRLWGSLIARQGGKDTYVGTYMCIIVNAPDVTPAGTSVVCSPKGNNNAPDNMFVPKNAKLFVATTVTFGHVQSTPMKAVPVEIYGP